MSQFSCGSWPHEGGGDNAKTDKERMVLVILNTVYWNLVAAFLRFISTNLSGFPVYVLVPDLMDLSCRALKRHYLPD